LISAAADVADIAIEFAAETPTAVQPVRVAASAVGPNSLAALIVAKAQSLKLLLG
jgi:hypothetical protein